jgi:hypothetical protein
LIFNVLWIAGYFQYPVSEPFSLREEEAAFFSQMAPFYSSPEI